MKRSERDFLHDLSGPLGALQLHLEHMADIFRKSHKDHPELSRIEKAVMLIHRTGAVLAQRRTELREIASEEASEEASDEKEGKE